MNHVEEVLQSAGDFIMRNELHNRRLTIEKTALLEGVVLWIDGIEIGDQCLCGRSGVHDLL